MLARVISNVGVKPAGILFLPFIFFGFVFLVLLAGLLLLPRGQQYRLTIYGESVWGKDLNVWAGSAGVLNLGDVYAEHSSTAGRPLQQQAIELTKVAIVHR